MGFCKIKDKRTWFALLLCLQLFLSCTQNNDQTRESQNLSSAKTSLYDTCVSQIGSLSLVEDDLRVTPLNDPETGNNLPFIQKISLDDESSSIIAVAANIGLGDHLKWKLYAIDKEKALVNTGTSLTAYHIFCNLPLGKYQIELQACSKEQCGATVSQFLEQNSKHQKDQSKKIAQNLEKELCTDLELQKKIEQISFKAWNTITSIAPTDDEATQDPLTATALGAKKLGQELYTLLVLSSFDNTLATTTESLKHPQTAKKEASLALANPTKTPCIPPQNLENVPPDTLPKNQLASSSGDLKGLPSDAFTVPTSTGDSEESGTADEAQAKEASQVDPEQETKTTKLIAGVTLFAIGSGIFAHQLLAAQDAAKVAKEAELALRNSAHATVTERQPFLKRSKDNLEKIGKALKNKSFTELKAVFKKSAESAAKTTASKALKGATEVHWSNRAPKAGMLFSGVIAIAGALIAANGALSLADPQNQTYQKVFTELGSYADQIQELKAQRKELLINQ